TERGPREVDLAFTARPENGPAAALVVSILPHVEGAFATDLFAARVASATLESPALLAALRGLWDAVLAAGARPVYPPGPDAIGTLSRAVAARLGRLRGAAPFGELSWLRTDEVPGGVELMLASPRGERLIAWVIEQGGKVRSGYRVE